jgi:trehalose 6-phosphate synthase
MLVLSCFAGAADELGEAIIIHPHDREGVAEAIVQGLEMPSGERRERWTAMMTTLRRNDIDAWRRGFVAALTAAGASR